MIEAKNVDWTKVLKCADMCFREIHLGDTDNEHYLYETVMSTIYGESFWKEKKSYEDVH